VYINFAVTLDTSLSEYSLPVFHSLSECFPIGFALAQYQMPKENRTSYEHFVYPNIVSNDTKDYFGTGLMLRKTGSEYSDKDVSRVTAKLMYTKLIKKAVEVGVLRGVIEQSEHPLITALKEWDLSYNKLEKINEVIRI
jgi:hypothetical protein